MHFREPAVLTAHLQPRGMHRCQIVSLQDEVRYLAGMPPAHKRLYNEDIKHSLLQDFCQVELTIFTSMASCLSHTSIKGWASACDR